MAKYTPSLEEIKSLRAKTAVGINDCKSALQEAQGNIDEAVKILRQKGVAKGEKRAGRTASEGTIGIYSHNNNSVISLVELNCETDFVAKNNEFQNLAYELAVHVAAMGTQYIDRDSVPQKVLEEQKAEIQKQLKGKPEEVQNKMIEGKLEKFYKENCLMEQQYFKDDSRTVQDLINETLAKIGEKIEISRILIWRVGKPGGYCSIIPKDLV